MAVSRFIKQGIPTKINIYINMICAFSKDERVSVFYKHSITFYYTAQVTANGYQDK